MIFKATLIGTLAIVASVIIALACAEDERYEENAPPHETWKDRGEYCFAVKVDPLGGGNTTWFWADEVEEGYSPDGSRSDVRARNVRVADYRYASDPGDEEEDDYYQPGIVRIIEDGSIAINERCY